MKIKKIFSRNIALKLMASDNKLLYTEQNRNKPWLVVFCFEETNTLLHELSALTQHSA
ncbi:MAG: hypothetical protein ABF633_01635 [Clostridium sp.]|uniref:hypothetical protein n=1 Tax=Clostridium sp. TaxID=1506 RepID=UPI0039E77073